MQSASQSNNQAPYRDRLAQVGPSSNPGADGLADAQVAGNSHRISTASRHTEQRIQSLPRPARPVVVDGRGDQETSSAGNRILFGSGVAGISLANAVQSDNSFLSRLLQPSTRAVGAGGAIQAQDVIRKFSEQLNVEHRIGTGLSSGTLAVIPELVGGVLELNIEQMTYNDKADVLAFLAQVLACVHGHILPSDCMNYPVTGETKAMTAAQLLYCAKRIRITAADQRHVRPANRHPIAGAAPSRLGGTVLDRFRANDRVGQAVNNPSTSLRHLVPKADWSKVPNPDDPTCPKTLSAALLNYLAGEHNGFKVKPDEVNQRLFVHHMRRLPSQLRSDDTRAKIAQYRSTTLEHFPDSAGWFEDPAFLMLLVMELEERRPQPYSQGPITVAEKATSAHYVRALAEKIKAIDGACAVSCLGEQALNQFATSFPVVPSEVIHNVWENIGKHTQFIAQYWDFADTSEMGGRYTNIRGPRQFALLDQTRNASTYLHANFLDTGRGMRMIASQKPITGEPNSTAEAFWLASLKENVALIVDLTNAQDNAHDGQHYGPAGGGQLDFNGVSVGRQSVMLVRGGELESLIVKERATGREHFVKRLNFQHWPDHGVVEPSQLIDLAKAVHAHTNSSDTVLVHCMAGVGRTGTLLTFLMAKQELRNIQRVKGHVTPRGFAEIIPKAVIRGRLDRGPDFVQTKEQFQLLANALMMEMGSAVSSKS